MRFVKGVLTILLSLGLVVAVVWIVTPEVMIWWTATELRGQLMEVIKLAKRPAHYEACGLAATTSSSKSLQAYQLRFEDEKNYVIEAVCNNLTGGAIEVVRKQLPFRVEKEAGYSGVKVFLDSEINSEGRVVLNLWGRRWWVGLRQGQASMARVWTKEKLEAGREVDNVCSGWGYLCCSEVNQVGRGEKVTKGVMDCPGSCYQTCLSLPTVASFVTDPYVDENRRVMLERGGQQVTFSWNVLDLDGQVGQVTLNFGDGSQEIYQGESGMTTHQYGCNDSGCRFVVKLSAVDNDNLMSKETPMSSLTVVVGN